jgi:hypothetical protein
MVTAVSAMLLGALPARAECPPPPENVTAVEARADGTLLLADGRMLRLAGVELTDRGRTSLGARVRNKPLTIRPLGKPDRWNRVSAHLDGVEEVLLADGLGHAAAQVPGACLGPLLEAEAKARAARSGIWSRRDYAMAARDGAALTEKLGRHVLAEGKVESARLYRGRVYLNFARYWKSGLSLIIAEKNWPLFAGGAAAESFAGRRVRARGRLEWRSGPAILAGPDDRIEVLGP